jgi:hypothetical protein
MVTSETFMGSFRENSLKTYLDIGEFELSLHQLQQKRIKMQ